MTKNYFFKKKNLLVLDEMQDQYMKLLQKQTVCDSFNNKKIKPRNKLILIISTNLLILKKSNKELKDSKLTRLQGLNTYKMK